MNISPAVTPAPEPDEVATIMQEAGYEAHHAGGNLWVWRKTHTADRTALVITCDGNINGDPEAPEWSAGRYSTMGCGCIDLNGTFTLALALKLAPLLPSPIAQDGTEDQRAIQIHEAYPDVREGRHVRFTQDVERFPEALIPAGTTGTIKEYNDLETFVFVKLDVDFPGLSHWQNCLVFSGELAGGEDTGFGALLSCVEFLD